MFFPLYADRSLPSGVGYTSGFLRRRAAPVSLVDASVLGGHVVSQPEVHVTQPGGQQETRRQRGRRSLFGADADVGGGLEHTLASCLDRSGATLHSEPRDEATLSW